MMMLAPIPVGRQQVKRVRKRWGAEHWIVNDEKYCLKVLVLDPALQCSLHLHPKKRETFLVTFGECFLEYGKRVRRLSAGMYQTIQPGVPHRFSLPGGNNDLCIIIEASTQHSDEDVIRLEESGPCKPSKREPMLKAPRITNVCPFGYTKKMASKSSASGTRGSSSRKR